MELRQLKYFLAVADSRSFVSASSSLFVSRQAVSKAISQLENELGVELFMRDSNGAFLTPAGVMFYDRVHTNVLELDNLRDEVQRYGSRYYQRVRLLFSEGTMRLYEEALSSFREAQTNVHVDYDECPEALCRKHLLEHMADLVICTEKLTEPMFSCEPILSSPYGLLLRDTEALSSGESVALSDLKWLPIGVRSDSQVLQLCETNGIRPQYRGLDLYRLFSLTAEGRCAMLLPEKLAPSNWPGLRWLPVADLADRWTLYRVSMQTVEKNILYRTVLDDLQMRVFDEEGGAPLE